MIPIQLTLEGLYSYQARQTIDFTNLIEAGLFGIFGAVGSGKSSILEAISFALYGETERLNSRGDKRSYNMMNLKSNRAYIEFDFTNFENRVFRTTREFKRNSKNFEDVKSQTPVFYEKIAEQWVPLEHTSADKLIGLSYENFKRTIIIPQGQFREFLELGATERTRMMKEIFSLQRYDLQENVKRLYSKNTTELNQIEGQLKGFEEVSPEIILEKQQLHTQQKSIFETVENNYKTLQISFQILQNLKADFEALQAKSSQFNQLKQQKESIDQQAEQLAVYEKLNLVFRPLLDDQTRESNALEQHKKGLVIAQATFKEVENERLVTEYRLKEVKKAMALLPHKRLQETDLNHLFQIAHFIQQINRLNERTTNGKTALSSKIEQLTAFRNKLDQNSIELEQLKKLRLDSSVLMEVSTWFNEKKSLDKEAIQLQETLGALQDKSKAISAELTALNVDPKLWKVQLDTEILQANSQLKRIQDQKEALVLQQELAHYAAHLKPGENCPLCGSLEHPSILRGDDNQTEALKAVEIQQQKAQQMVLALQKKELTIETILHRQSEQEQVLNELNQKIKGVKEQLEAHQTSFKWTGFSSTDEQHFNTKKIEAETLEKVLINKENQLIAQRKEWENLTLEVDKYKDALNNFELEEAKLRSSIEAHQQQLKVLLEADYINRSPEQLAEEAEQLQQENKETEQAFERDNAQFLSIYQRYAELKNTVEVTQQNIQQTEVQLVECRKKLQNALKAHHLETENDVQTILAQNLDTATIRSQINQFLIQYETLKNSMTELSERLKNKEFSAEAFNNQHAQLLALEASYKEHTEALAKLSAEIERLNSLCQQKKAILEAQSSFQKRADNLKIMKSLFDQSGFVKYVSSIYLKQLCDNANVRFHRMTRNQLSLQLSDTNEFEIIDYLNEGRSRSVKTLSGGQSFQVSLSLALALAESVQADAQAQRNFFFIDEGFGTQDAESVNTVFETLTNLQKENRIVGIISHVEELQERMPISLTIEKDEEKGSYVVEQRL